MVPLPSPAVASPACCWHNCGDYAAQEYQAQPIVYERYKSEHGHKHDFTTGAALGLGAAMLGDIFLF